MAHKDYSTPKPNRWITVGGVTKTGEKNVDRVTGYYLGSEEGPDKFNPGKTKHTHMLQTSEGIVAVNSTTNMTRKFTEATANFTAENGKGPLGAEVIVKYEGMTKLANGNTMKTYKVTFDADNTIEAGSQEDLAVGYTDADDEDEAAEEYVSAAPTPAYAARAPKSTAELKATKESVLAKLKNRK